jgi:ferredoxin-type protein NapG
MDPTRRAFFRQVASKTGETLVQEADKQVARRAAHWIRPPYALDELEFLLACTRCNACIEACPHQVIFPLQARLGVQFAGTPALDLINKSCHLCEDWPCVGVCEPNALCLPVREEDDPLPPPKLARAEIDTERCLPWQGPECGACAASCPQPGALVWENWKPVIDAALCIGCGQCREACIIEPRAIHVSSLYRAVPDEDMALPR